MTIINTPIFYLLVTILLLFLYLVNYSINYLNSIGRIDCFTNRKKYLFMFEEFQSEKTTAILIILVKHQKN